MFIYVQTPFLSCYIYFSLNAFYWVTTHYKLPKLFVCLRIIYVICEYTNCSTCITLYFNHHRSGAKASSSTRTTRPASCPSLRTCTTISRPPCGWTPTRWPKRSRCRCRDWAPVRSSGTRNSGGRTAAATRCRCFSAVRIASGASRRWWRTCSWWRCCRRRRTAAGRFRLSGDEIDAVYLFCIHFDKHIRVNTSFKIWYELHLFNLWIIIFCILMIMLTHSEILFYTWCRLLSLSLPQISSSMCLLVGLICDVVAFVEGYGRSTTTHSE